MNTSHPSFLALDLHATGQPDPAVEVHVAQCDRCRGHLGRLGLPVAVPAWVTAPPAARRPAWYRPLAAVLGLAAASVALGVISLRLDDDAKVTAKGAPAVRVHVKRGSETWVWNGVQPLRAGDALQVEVAPSRLKHLALANRVGPGPFAVLHRAELSADAPVMTPLSWTIDADPRTEELLVVVSAAPVPESELATLAAAPSSDDTFVVRYQLTKQQP